MTARPPTNGPRRSYQLRLRVPLPCTSHVRSTKTTPLTCTSYVVAADVLLRPQPRPPLCTSAAVVIFCNLLTAERLCSKKGKKYVTLQSRTVVI